MNSKSREEKWGGVKVGEAQIISGYEPKRKCGSRFRNGDIECAAPFSTKMHQNTNLFCRLIAVTLAPAIFTIFWYTNCTKIMTLPRALD